MTGDGRNLIDAGAGNDAVATGAGDDWILGGPGRDVLVGGAGSDLLDGGLGNNLLVGGSGNDVLVGGAGTDILFDGRVTVTTPATDSLAKVLASYVPMRRSSLVNIAGRIQVTFDPAGADSLFGGAGLDWFWTADPTEAIDRQPAEPSNGF